MLGAPNPVLPKAGVEAAANKHIVASEAKQQLSIAVVEWMI